MERGCIGGTEAAFTQRMGFLLFTELELESVHQPVVDEDISTHVLSASVALILDEELDIDVVFAVGIEVKLVLGLAGVSENSGNEVVLDISGHVDVAGLSVCAVRDTHRAAEAGGQVKERIFGNDCRVVVHHGAIRGIENCGWVQRVRRVVVVRSVARLDFDSELAG